MKNIIKRMQHYYPVSEESINEFARLVHPLEKPMGEMLISPGQLSGHVYFIEKGLTRSFCILNGAEINSWFSYEGDMTFTMNELYCNMLGFEYVELLEDCLLYAIAIPEFNKLQEDNIEFCNWSRICHQHHLYRSQCSRLALLGLSAEEHYIKLLTEQPNLLQRIPLKHLASHMGITPQSLSRIRATMHKN